MKPYGEWIIEVWWFDKTTRTGRWIAWRHLDGEKNVARFGCFGKLKRYVARHAIGLGTGIKVRAHHSITHEYRDVVRA